MKIYDFVIIYKKQLFLLFFQRFRVITFSFTKKCYLFYRFITILGANNHEFLEFYSSFVYELV